MEWSLKRSMDFLTHLRHLFFSVISVDIFTTTYSADWAKLKPTLFSFINHIIKVYSFSYKALCKLLLKCNLFNRRHHKCITVWTCLYTSVLPCRSTAGCRSWASSAGGPALQSGHSTQHRWRRRCSGGTDRAAGTLLWSRSLWILSVNILSCISDRHR